MTDHLHLLGVRVDRVGGREALALMERFMQERGRDGPRQVVTINPEFVVQAQDDPSFRAVLNAADLNLADGVGIVWASHVVGAPVPERVAGVDAVERLAALAGRQGYRIYFLGGRPGVAEGAARTLAARYGPDLVAGAQAGSPAEEKAGILLEAIGAARADALLVAFGAPTQDGWIARHRPSLDVGLAMGVGGAFDFITGAVPRAPRPLQRLGLEWAFRLVRQPWRWRRMLRLPRFVWLVLRQGRRGGICPCRPHPDPLPQGEREHQPHPDPLPGGRGER